MLKSIFFIVAMEFSMLTYLARLQKQILDSVIFFIKNYFDEWSIQTIMYMARTFVVHMSLHRSKYGADNLVLSGFAVKHDVWLHNGIPFTSLDLHP